MGMPAVQTAEMTKRLNEAEPTMVNEPSGPTTMLDLRSATVVRGTCGAPEAGARTAYVQSCPRRGRAALSFRYYVRRAGGGCA